MDIEPPVTCDGTRSHVVARVSTGLLSRRIRIYIEERCGDSLHISGSMCLLPEEADELIRQLTVATAIARGQQDPLGVVSDDALNMARGVGALGDLIRGGPA